MSGRVRVTKSVSDGAGRRISIEFSDGTVMKFRPNGRVMGKPTAVIQDADGWDDDATLWVEDNTGTQALACTLGDLRRALNALGGKA